jgi:hypothetical protein
MCLHLRWSRWVASSNLKILTNSSHTVDSITLDTIKRLHPPGSKVRIVKDSRGSDNVELNDTYTIIRVRRTDRLDLRDNLGNCFTWPLVDCVHPGLDVEWLQLSSPAFAKGSVTRTLLQGFTGKRFLRLRPAIRDRILSQEPDLKERILEMLETLKF